MSNRARSTWQGGANYVLGVRYANLLAGALSLVSFGIAWYAFTSRFERAHDPEIGQIIADATGRPASTHSMVGVGPPRQSSPEVPRD